MPIINTVSLERIRSTGNIAMPFLAAAAVYGNTVCDTGCTYLYGSLLGVDLNLLGIFLAGAVLLLSLPLPSRVYRRFSDFLRANLLCGALGGGLVLLHFQITNQIICLFCMVYGLIVLLLFVLNVHKTSKIAGFGAFAAGLLLFALFFEGSTVPMFNV